MAAINTIPYIRENRAREKGKFRRGQRSSTDSTSPSTNKHEVPLIVQHLITCGAVVLVRRVVVQTMFAPRAGMARFAYVAYLRRQIDERYFM